MTTAPIPGPRLPEQEAEAQTLRFAEELAQLVHPPTSVSGRLSARLQGARKSILVADDEPWIRRLIVATLNGRYDLIEARTGLEVIEIVQSMRPDLALLDISMPGLDGLQACLRINEEQLSPDTRLVVVSGLSDEVTRAAALRAGAYEFFGKPFSPTALLHFVDRALS